MFACSQVETENLFYNPKNSYNKKRETSPSNKSHKSKITFNLPYNNNCNNNFMITENDSRMKYHEASVKRHQLQQELQRRHQFCAEKERLCRERAEKQTALKKVEECNALRKFYELKSAQLKNNNGLRRSMSSSSSSSNSTTSSSSTTTTTSSSIISKKSLPSRSMSSSIKRFQAAYKIYSFIKHHIEKRNTQKIISNLIKLRSMQNQLSLLKSINLKGNLTFESNKNNEVLPISVNNKAFLIYKESILKILNKLNNDFSDEYYLVREKKISIINTVNIMLRDLDNFRDSQYKNSIKNIENRVDDDFVIINRT
ncbi:hypothetical protein RclHR1_14000003 [Rhizophagus clarus]|uniref:BAG domain-containing protein n=1 Tax=Rhizophagus clarus TaxID=94130 RepID=A0A2Z6QP12_9GLOM|nr:hypothetical protein RclHR1_14000003 [Rhizophagus clarus]GES79028.1 hypothetical protein GLOIN_2v1732799 [Rhizophagus clarus]